MPEPEEQVEEQGPQEEKEPRPREEKTSEETTPNKGPSPVIIIIAAVVVLILIIAGIYFLAFSGSELESVAVGNISMKSDQIEFSIYATPSGVGDYTGKVTVEVAFHEPVKGGELPTRKSLAQYCHVAVTRGVDEALCGRRAPRPDYRSTSDQRLASRLESCPEGWVRSRL